jgi:hypothetical protein
MPIKGCLEAHDTPVTAMVWCLKGYEFTLHLMPITISHPSLLLALGFFSFPSSANHQWRTRKASSVSALLLQREVLCHTMHKLHHWCHPDLHLHWGSPSNVSLHHRCSAVFEQGSASGVTLVSGPSLLVVDTSRVEEFARKIFGGLNRDILGPPGDGKIIIIDHSDDDDEAQEEGTAGVDPTVVPASAADAPAGTRVDNSDHQGSEKEADGGDDSGRSTGAP